MAGADVANLISDLAKSGSHHNDEGNSQRDGKFRKIKIETANHDLKVLARKGYYAPKG